MRAFFSIILLATLTLPITAFAETQTFTATHTYILGDHDSKDDARQRCLLETKRKILEHAGVYIESASEVRNFDLTKDKITSFAAAVMQVKDTKENFWFENGHMTMMLKLTAQVDLVEVRKHLAARQADAGVREDVAVQKESLKRLEAQLKAMQREQNGQSSEHATASLPIGISAEELQTLHTQAAQGDATAQYHLGVLYYTGDGVPQDYTKARQWLEKAATQGDAKAQVHLGLLYHYEKGVPKDYAKARQWYEKAAAQGDALAKYHIGLLYHFGEGVPKDYAKARQWYEKAAAQGDANAQYNIGMMFALGHGVPQDSTKARQWWEKAAAQGKAKAQHNIGVLYYFGESVPQDYVRAYMWLNLAAADSTDDKLEVTHSTGDAQKSRADMRDEVARFMTFAQIAEAQRLSQQCQARQFKGC